MLLQHTVLVFAQNNRGVLERIAMMIRKKMYNLEQITASPTETPNISRLTISFSRNESSKLPQIVSQLKKIIEVVDVRIVDPATTVIREVALVKIKRPELVSELSSVIRMFKANVVFTSQDYIIAEMTGSPENIQHFLLFLKTFEILEIGTSGGVAMEK
jgi:acetolactate synthase-1/3 small subunit